MCVTGCASLPAARMVTHQRYLDLSIYRQDTPSDLTGISAALTPIMGQKPMKTVQSCLMVTPPFP